MDNYGQFIERLDAATAKLTARRESLSETLDILTTLFAQNNTGLGLWEEREARCGELLAARAGHADFYSTLNDLHSVALKMKPMFRTRTQRLGERVAVVRGRRDVIDKSLLELQKSRLKLDSSRMIAEERENLRKAVASIAGAPGDPVVALDDPALRGDLDDAHQAVILAEALLEAKGG